MEQSSTELVVALGQHLHAAGISHVGKVRPHNEDAFRLSDDATTLIVSDGIGGHAGGATASRLVVENLPSELAKALAAKDSVEAAITEAVLQTNVIVRQGAQQQSRLAGMGATLVMLLEREGNVHIGHLGDSRGYRLRDGELEPLTTDHTLAAMLYKHGSITREEYQRHPSRGRLLQYMGMPDHIMPDVAELDTKPGDRLLICSDGLSSHTEHSAMVSAITNADDPASACEHLLEAALLAGGEDNITIVVADVV